MSLPSPITSKVSAKRAVLYGALVVNVPVILLMVAAPGIAFYLLILGRIPIWFAYISLPLGFTAAWLWWSLATPRWRLWAMRRADNLYKLHLLAVRNQLVWPRGHIFENTEFKSPLHVLYEKHVEIRHYFDKFRYYLDYLDSTGRGFSGLGSARDEVDVFREFLYVSVKADAAKSLRKAAIDRLRLTLKSIRSSRNDVDWVGLIDGLTALLDGYQISLKSELSRA